MTRPGVAGQPGRKTPYPRRYQLIQPESPTEEPQPPPKTPQLFPPWPPGPTPRWRSPFAYDRIEQSDDRAEEEERNRQAEPDREKHEYERAPPLHFGVAQHYQWPNLLHTLRARGTGLLATVRQVAWLLTARNLPSTLKTLWRLLAREITEPRFLHTKRPRKAKAPRPF